MRMTTRMLSSQCRVSARAESIRRNPKSGNETSIPQISMLCCGVQYEYHHWVAHPEQGGFDQPVLWSTGVRTTLYLPRFNGLFEARVKVSPAFEIRPVNATLLEGFHRAGYLLRPEIVQFCVTKRNLSQH